MSNLFSKTLKSFIEKLLEKELGSKVVIEMGSPKSGGCINCATLIKTDAGNTFFLKYNPSSPSNMFQAEANGLKELSKAEQLRVPKVIAFSEYQADVTPFILMEYLPSAQKSDHFFELFGRGFAQMHQIKQQQYGFFENNFIGSTPQINDLMDNWVDFFREKRLGYQVELAKKSNLWSSKLDQLWDQLSSKLEEIIGEPNEPPSLLHGDLWSGNYIVGPEGKPCIIDPAVYYGNREADLSMTELFGGFDRRFYDSYKEAYPLEPGYNDRVKVYKLYHLLNHLNLFGSSYQGSVKAILQHFAD